VILRFALLLLLALLLGHGNLVMVAAIYAGLIAVAYAVSLMRHPHRRCRSCGGTGRHRGAMFTWGDRPCTTCGGAPRHRRWGVQATRPDTQTWAERAAARARKRPSRPR